MTALLAVHDLTVSLGPTILVSGLSLQLEAGDRLGIIGESGSGKTVTALAVMGLLPGGMTARGRVLLDGEDLLTARERRLAELRGKRLAMVFQEPTTALDPVMRVGRQVAEAIRAHTPCTRRTAWQQAARLLGEVGLEDPSGQARAFPHELSGGQRQRVLLAIALACRPALLLADEPTSALDVLRQQQLLALLRERTEHTGAALVLISHDLAVVAALCRRLVVLYGGRPVEWGPVASLLARPRHPYTAALVATSLAVSVDRDRRPGPLPSFPGNVPEPGSLPAGCVFRPRCGRATDRCGVAPPIEVTTDGVACWHPLAPGAPTAPAPAPAACSSVGIHLR